MHSDRTPKVQAEPMIVYIFFARGVVLDNAIVIVPKQLLHLAHLIPCRAPIFAANADVLPTCSVACNDENLLVVP